MAAGARRAGRARRVPDFLEERAADQEHDVGAVERLADGRPCRTAGSGGSSGARSASPDGCGCLRTTPPRRDARRAPPPRPRALAASSPATMTGRRLASRSCGGRLDAGRVGLGRAVETPGREHGSTSVSCSSTSIGNATNTGPAGGSVAILSARCRISANSSARSTCDAPLGRGRGHRHQIVAEHRPAQPQARVLAGRPSRRAASAAFSAL